MNYEVLQPPPETTVAAESCFDSQHQVQRPSLFALPAPADNELDFLNRCDRFKAVYSELLYRWQLLVKVCFQDLTVNPCQYRGGIHRAYIAYPNISILTFPSFHIPFLRARSVASC